MDVLPTQPDPPPVPPAGGPATGPGPNEWLGPKEAADLLGCSRSFVYRLLRAKPPLLRHEKRGATYRVRRAWVDEYRRTTRRDPQGTEPSTEA